MCEAAEVHVGGARGGGRAPLADTLEHRLQLFLGTGDV